jgi:acetyl esterase/lipase
MKSIMKCWSGALAVTTLCLCLSSCSGGDAVKRTTLSYCSPGGVGLLMDVFTPVPAPSAAVGAVVYVHGGGWVTGTDALPPLMRTIEQEVIDSGDVFVSLNYRLAPAFLWPAQIEDVKCAIRFLRFDAKPLHINPGHIGAIGDSAGGQLVSLLGLTSSSAGFDVGQYLSESSAVQAVVDLYGPTDLTSPDWKGDTFIQNYARQEFGQALGGSTTVLIGASPVAHAVSGAPPFLIVQGAEDTVVPPGQSQELFDRLKALGDSAQLITVENAGHGLLHVGSRPEEPDPAQLSTTISEFLSTHLGRV